MAELVIKLVNGDLAGKTMQEITKEVTAAALAVKKAEIGTQAWVDANKKLEDSKKLQQDLKKQIESTAQASDMLKQAWNKLPGAQYFNQVADSFGMMKKGVGGLVSQFGVLKSAIIATGIGALVVAVITLVEWFKKTDEGATLLSGIFKGLGVVVDTVFGGLIDLFKSLSEYFTGKKSLKQGLIDLVEFLGNNLLNRVKAFLVIWDGIKNLDLKKATDGLIQLGTGITDATDKMANFGKSIADAVNEGIQFEKQLDAIQDKARELSVLNAETEKNVAQLILQSKNVGLTYQQRIDLLDKAGKIELNNHKQQLQNARDLEALRKKEIEDNAKRNIQTDELDQALADATIARINLEKDSITLQEKIANRRTALIEKQIAEEQKAKDEALKAQHDLDEAAQKRADKEEKDRQDRLAKEEKDRQDKIAKDKELAETEFLTQQNALNEKHLAGKLSEEQYLNETAALVLTNEQQKLAVIKSIHGEQSLEYQQQLEKVLNIQQAGANRIAQVYVKLGESQKQALMGSLQTFGNVFGAIAGLHEQGTKQWKAAATAQAIISTIAGGINAYSSTAEIPIVGGILAPIAAAAALAAGYANVRKIQQTQVTAPVKKALGGPLYGPSHQNGGIPIEAEGGEFVFSRKAAASIGIGNLSRINDHYTRSFATGGPINPFQDRAPISSAASRSSVGSSSDQMPAWVSALIEAQDRKIARLQVVNVVSTPDKTGYQDKINVLNKIKNDADV